MSKDDIDDVVRFIQSFFRFKATQRRQALRHEERARKEAARSHQESCAAEVERKNNTITHKIAALNNTLRDGLGINFKPRDELALFFGIKPFRKKTDQGAPASINRTIPGNHSQSNDWEADLWAKPPKRPQPAPLFDEATLDFSNLLEREIDHFNSAHVISYFEHMLLRDTYPTGFPQKYKISYHTHAKRLIVDYQLPNFDIVPTCRAYRYIKTRNEVAEITRPISERRKIYISLIAMIALRVMHAAFEADTMDLIESIEFSGYVYDINKSTGARGKFYLVSVTTARKEFEQLHLNRVDPLACLIGLHASITPQPDQFVG